MLQCTVMDDVKNVYIPDFCLPGVGVKNRRKTAKYLRTVSQIKIK